MRRICVVSGSRADYGLLSVPMALIRDDPELELQLVVTGQHLVPGAGDSCDEIARDGFRIDRRVDMGLDGDDAAAVTAAMGRALIGFADAFARLQPHLLLVLGDRYEILAAVEAALLARIPVAHVAGGDVTEGAIDDSIRHAVTKMAHVHFVTTEQAGHRVRQLGEDPSAVHVVGSPGLDRIRLTPVPGRNEFFASIGFEPRPRNLLVTFHPVTAEGDSAAQCRELLAALDALGSDIGLVFTGANADVEGRMLNRMVAEFVAARGNAALHASLGPHRYYGALRHADAVVGNSSSGLYEAPSFGIPTVNIGSRQDGRLRAASVIDCRAERDAIGAAIARALQMQRGGVTNPYGDGHAAERIVGVLKRLDDPRTLLKKRFVDWMPA